jgi:hypothetical protein
MRFDLDHVVATPGALTAPGGSWSDAAGVRHSARCWPDRGGSWTMTTARSTGDSLQEGCCLLSAYRLRDGTRIWIITEADRSATTLLLLEEY